MKKLILAAAVLFAGAAASVAHADMISIKKMKCSTFGNLKIKVNGLERHRSLGTGYLKANVPLFDSCKDALNEVAQTMGRGTQSAGVTVTKTIVRQEERRGGGGNHKTWDVVCHVSELTTLAMTFDRMPELKFRNTRSRHLRTEYGYCRN